MAEKFPKYSPDERVVGPDKKISGVRRRPNLPEAVPEIDDAPEVLSDSPDAVDLHKRPRLYHGDFSDYVIKEDEVTLPGSPEAILEAEAVTELILRKKRFSTKEQIKNIMGKILFWRKQND